LELRPAAPLSRRPRLKRAARLFCLTVSTFLGIRSVAAQEPPDQDGPIRVVDQLVRAQRFEDALPLARAVVDAAQSYYGLGYPRVTNALTTLGIIYEGLRNYNEAEGAYRQALDSQERQRGRDDIDVARAMVNLARAVSFQPGNAGWRTFLVRAVQLILKAQGPKDDFDAGAVEWLAGVYREDGDFPGAAALLRDAQGIRLALHGLDSPEVAGTLHSRAILSQLGGDFNESLAFLEDALKAYRDAKRLADVANVLNTKSSVFMALGRQAEALDLLTEASKAAEDGHAPKGLRADILDARAIIERLTKHYGRAEQDRLLAMEYRRSDDGIRSDSYSISAYNLAVLYADLGRTSEAETNFLAAEGIAFANHGVRSTLAAAFLPSHAELYIQTNRDKDALSLLETALSICQQYFGEYHLDNLRILEDLAALAQVQGRIAEAQAYYERAFALFSAQLQRDFVYMTEAERLLFLKSAAQAELFGRVLSLVWSAVDESPGLGDIGYNVALWQKQLVGDSITALRRRIVSRQDWRAVSLLASLGEKRRQVAELRMAPQSEPSSRATQVRMEDEAASIERELVAQSVDFGERERLLGARWENVKRSLGPTEAAVEFVQFPFFDGRRWVDDSRYAALVVTGRSGHPTFIRLGSSDQLGDALKQYAVSVGRTAINPGAASLSLYTGVWRRLEPALSGARLVYVAGTGLLNQVSWGAVSVGGGRFLIDDLDIRDVSTTRDLLSRDSQAGNKSVVLIGDPDFGLQGADWVAALSMLKETSCTDADVDADDREARGMGVTGWLPRAATASEIRDSSALFARRGWTTHVFCGRAALEEAVKRSRHPRVLHLATHGFFRDRGNEPSQSPLWSDWSEYEEPLLRSGLYFAGASNGLRAVPKGVDDGILTAYEATDLDLQGTELVVLSGCQTGLGDARGGEGVFGLRRAFRVAGAKAILMSLWAVAGQETKSMMVYFYQAWLSGRDKHDALLEAKQRVRREAIRSYGMDLPYYWGGFVLVGP
jgi:tetratricopeptide (TPR) repeat protein